MRFSVLSIYVAVIWASSLAQHLESVKLLWNRLREIKPHASPDQTWNDSRLDVLLSSPDLQQIFLTVIGVENKLTNLTLYLDQALEETRSRDDDNIVFSPVAIQNTLATILAVSKRQTFKEISRNLITNDDDDIAQNFPHILSDALREQDKVFKAKSLKSHEVASGIFVQDGYPILDGFEAAQKYFHNVRASNVNFSEKNAVEVINAWTMEKSETDTSITLSTLGNLPNHRSTNIAMVLSTFYYEGQWSENFKVKTSSPFKIDASTTVLVDMLNKYDHFPVHRDDKWGLRIIGLPDEKLNVTMYIILPNDPGISALQNLKKELTTTKLNDLIREMKPRKVNVSIPRMDLSSTTSLKSALKSLGVESLFDPSKADLSLLSSGPTKNDVTLPISSTPSSSSLHGESLPTPGALNRSPSTSRSAALDDEVLKKNKVLRDLPTNDKAHFNSNKFPNRVGNAKSLDNSSDFEESAGVGKIRYKDRSISFTTPPPKKVARPTDVEYELPKNIAVDPKMKKAELLNMTTRAPFIVTPESYTEKSQTGRRQKFNDEPFETTTKKQYTTTPSTVWITPRATTQIRPSYSTKDYHTWSRSPTVRSISVTIPTSTPTYRYEPTARSSTQGYPSSEVPVTRRTLLGNRESPGSNLPVPWTSPTYTRAAPSGGYDHTLPPGRRTSLGVRSTQTLPNTILPFPQVTADGVKTHAVNGFYQGVGSSARNCVFPEIEKNAVPTGPYTWESEDYLIEKWDHSGQYVCKYQKKPRQNSRRKRQVEDLPSNAEKTAQGLHASDFMHVVSFSMNGGKSGTEQSSNSSLEENTVPPESFEVNRPFLFFIKDDSTKLIWLWGSINKPTPFHSR